jgi:hypothetical protein
VFYLKSGRNAALFPQFGLFAIKPPIVVYERLPVFVVYLKLLLAGVPLSFAGFCLQ